MSLTLVIGPANSAKAGHVLGAYRAALARDPLLVVPTGDDAERYARELADEGVVFGGAVVRFRGLVDEIARRSGFAARRVGPLQRDRLIGAAVAGGRLDMLAASAAAPGFVRATGALIAELQRARIEPGRLRSALRAWAGEDPGRRRYGEEVASVYSGYRTQLERAGRVDDDLFAWRALDALRAEPGRWGEQPVFLYGFDDLTAAELDAVETLARVAGTEVMVSLTYEPGRFAFAGRARTFEELRPLADEVVELPPLADHYAAEAREELHRLERGLFEEPEVAAAAPEQPTLFDETMGHDARRAGTGAVRLLEAGGERAEIELVAAELLGLLRSGVPAEEIAVVFRSPARYASLVEQVFSAYGLPYALGASVPLRRTTLGAAVLAALRCALPGARAADVLAYLRTLGVLREPGLADRLEAGLRRDAVEGADPALTRFEELAGWRLDAIERLRDAGRRGGTALVGELRRLGARVLAAPHHRRAAVLDAAEAADARALAALDRALAELEELATARRTLAPEPPELAALLAGVEVRVGEAARPGAVEVVGPLEIRAHRYRAVVVAGLQEGEWPARGGAEPFLSDEQRVQVNAAAGLRLQPREDVLPGERFLFYAVASRPEQLLVLSHRTSDEEGSPVLPSPFLRDVEDALGARLEPSRRRPLAHVTWPVEEAPTEAERRRALRAAGPRREPGRAAPLRSDAVLGPLRERTMSAHALESYASCPVKWFVEGLLRARPLGPAAPALVQGGFRHELLERTLSRLRERTGSARVTPASLPEALAILHEAVDERRRETLRSPHEPTARAQARQIERELERYLAWEAESGSEWEPTHLELGFGFSQEEGGALPPLELGTGEVRVRGWVDRVDVDASGTRAVVRDYKTSPSGSAAAGAWEEKAQLQVALYLLVVRRLLGLRPVAGLYQPLRRSLKARGLVLEGEEDTLPEGGFAAGDVRSPEEFEALLEWAEGRACELAAEMRSGRLEPCPDTCTPRRRCAHPGICRSSPA